MSKYVLIMIIFLVGCASDSGSIEVTDQIFVLEGCEEAKRVNVDEPC